MPDGEIVIFVCATSSREIIASKRIAGIACLNIAISGPRRFPLRIKNTRTTIGTESIADRGRQAMIYSVPMTAKRISSDMILFAG